MKNKRLQQILDIIDRKPISTQEELLAELELQGIITTQATLSRDIKELNLSKGRVGESFVYKRPLTRDKNYQQYLKSAIKNIDYAVNNVVVKCLPGTASAVGAAIDQMNLAGILGTLAGDDTILIIAKSEQDAKNATNLIENI